ncbi:MAG: phosphoribosylanthranilate isomerase [Deltaproteobacteria bacterium]|nr:phosphoribosylanthranilate isomerase [Deltaproteobacteria bacterium]MBW2015816.1 phosphoribosylanthranilate isomerase [Deltaproteobacteria bacterium]
MIIQIYEIQTPEEAEKCIELGVDRIGSVILSAEEWRKPVIREVIRLSEGTRTKNSLIPLFQGETLLRTLDYYQPHFVHLCDNLTDRQGSNMILDQHLETQETLKKEFPEIGIMRSIPIPMDGKEPDFPFMKIARALEPVSDCFLIDTWVGEEPVEGFVGITGKTCDWKRAEELVKKTNIPVILAGGLSPENVRDALIQVQPEGADSCTGTNATGPEGHPIRFKKDFQKVRQFIQEVRHAETTIRENLEKRLSRLRQELEEREAALPAHSIRPHQLLAIEELEEEISRLESILESDLN